MEVPKLIPIPKKLEFADKISVENQKFENIKRKLSTDINLLSQEMQNATDDNIFQEKKQKLLETIEHAFYTMFSIINTFALNENEKKTRDNFLKSLKTAFSNTQKLKSNKEIEDEKATLEAEIEKLNNELIELLNAKPKNQDAITAKENEIQESQDAIDEKIPKIPAQNTKIYAKLDTLTNSINDLKFSEQTTNYENAKLSIIKELVRYRNNAVKEIQHEWDRTTPPDKELENIVGAKDKLIKHLKLLYFNNENTIVGRKEFFLFGKNNEKFIEKRNLKGKWFRRNKFDVNIEKKYIFKFLVKLENEKNPDEFKKLLDSLNLDNIADMSIKQHSSFISKFDQLYKKFNNNNDPFGLINIYNRRITKIKGSGAEQKKINEALKEHKKNYKIWIAKNKKLWVDDLYKLCKSTGIKEIIVNKKLIPIKQYIEKAYDDIANLNDKGVPKNNNKAFVKICNTILNKITINNDLKNGIKIPDDNQLNIDQKTAAIREFNKLGTEFERHKEFDEYDQYFTYKGKKSTFAKLHNTEVSIRTIAEEINGEEAKSTTIYLGQNAGCDLIKLMGATAIKDSNKVHVYDNDENGNPSLSITVHKNREIKLNQGKNKTQRDVYQFHESSFEKNTVLTLGKFADIKQGGVSVGLIKVDAQSRPWVEGTSTGKPTLTIGIMCQDIHAMKKNIGKLKSAFGTLALAGPNDKQTTVGDLIDNSIIITETPTIPHWKEKKESFYSHRIKQFRESASEKINNAASTIWGGIKKPFNYIGSKISETDSSLKNKNKDKNKNNSISLTNPVYDAKTKTNNANRKSSVTSTATISESKLSSSQSSLKKTQPSTLSTSETPPPMLKNDPPGSTSYNPDQQHQLKRSKLLPDASKTPPPTVVYRKPENTGQSKSHAGSSK